MRLTSQGGAFPPCSGRLATVRFIGRDYSVGVDLRASGDLSTSAAGSCVMITPFDGQRTAGRNVFAFPGRGWTSHEMCEDAGAYNGGGGARHRTSRDGVFFRRDVGGGQLPGFCGRTVRRLRAEPLRNRGWKGEIHSPVRSQRRRLDRSRVQQLARFRDRSAGHVLHAWRGEGTGSRGGASGQGQPARGCRRSEQGRFPRCGADAQQRLGQLAAVSVHLLGEREGLVGPSDDQSHHHRPAGSGYCGP